MSSGLVGHWKFNEKSGITANDSSRYRNTGTLTGATHLPKWGEKGIIFDGVNDYVDAGNNASLNITNTITVSAWFKTSVIAADTTGGSRIYYNGMSVGTKFSIGFRGTNIAIFYRDIIGTSQEQLLSSKNYYDERWHHLIGVHNGSALFLYYDGTLANTVNDTFSSETTDRNKMGTREPASGNFNGSIDEVRIYNRALSALEIKRLYNSTKHKYI